jgi:hypothetical protein
LVAITTIQLEALTMDKIKFGLFDVFAYAIPGMLVLLVFPIAYTNLSMSVYTFAERVMMFSEKVSFNSILLFVFVGYVTGFVLHFLGYNYFNRVAKKIWKNRLKGKEKGLSKFEAKFVLVRHYSKENYSYAEQWMTFRAMSFNISLAFLIIGLTILIKVICSQSFRLDWIVVSIVLFLMAAITLRRAVTFHAWSHDTLDNAISTLNLADK